MANKATIVGASVAVVGVAFGAWRIWPHVSNSGAVPSLLDPDVEALREQMEEARTNDDPARYAAPADASEAASLVRSAEANLVSAASAVLVAPDLAAQAPRTFAEAARLALEPLLTGDFEAYQASVAVFGGTMPDSPDELAALRSAYLNGTKLIALAPFDPDGVQVRAFATDGRKRAMEADIPWMVSAGLAGVRESTNPDRYALVASYTSRRLDAWEAMIPIRLRTTKGEGPGVLSVALAWDPVERRWVPVEYRVYYSVDTGLSSVIM